MNKNLISIFMVFILSMSLYGCNSQEEKAESEISKNESSVSNTIKENINSEETIYDKVAYCENRGVNIEDAIRTPSEYENKIFTIQGVVKESKTQDNGIQEVMLNIITDTYLYDYENGSDIWVKLNYNPDKFDGKRLVNGDEVGFVANFKGIENDPDYNDVALFEIYDKLEQFEYISIISLEEYFKSLGADTSSMKLNIVNKIDGNETLEKAVQMADYDINGMTDFEFEYDSSLNEDEDFENIKVFSSGANENIYWLTAPTLNGINEVILYSAEIDSDGELKFEYKGNVVLDNINL